ncbi:MAG TPA: DeoR family transcriptional regulator [Candidatus Paceibacterota bacterium]
MNVRTKAILEAAIKQYIREGKPVSSKELAKDYDFGVKDATVRNELNELTQEGFLMQTHTSGGRVPTDKGYQFFVAQTFSDVADTKRIINERYGALAGELKHGKLQDFIKSVSDETQLLGVGKKEKEPTVYKSGFEELVDHLDMDTKQEFQEIVHDFEMLDTRMDALRSRVFGKALPAPQVFIGKQSPITHSENLSVILDSYEIGGEKVVIALIGPKRMDYPKNMKLLKLFHTYFNEYERG